MAKKTRATKAAGKRKTSAGGTTASAVMVINMIPASLSGETNQDSEPNIAVNPQNPNQIVATAFTPDPAGGNLAPVFLSNDGGQTWSLNTIVPSAIPGREAITGDISVAFSPKSNVLYAGILRFPSPPNDTRLNILRAKNASAGTQMEVLADRNGVDQPFLIGGVSNNGGADHVYVGDNDLATLPKKTSTVDACQNGAQAKAKFKALRVDGLPGNGQNGPQVRPACHPDGTVYVGFYRWLAQSGDWEANTLVVTADAVLVRDDQGASGTKAFQDLLDGDGSLGRRVAPRVTFPFHSTGQGVPGQQRRGGDIAVAVDPNDSSIVYFAWGAVDPSGGYFLHLRQSKDRGKTWSANDVRTIPEAINPALAVNAKGLVGFAYQQLTGSGSSQRWVTHFQCSQDATLAKWDDLVLANVPANTPSVGPPAGFDPYLGDYIGLVSVGTNFFGTFCANNTPDQANFPNGVTFQRSHDFATRRLLDAKGRPVAVSIDPFFFRVTR
jgi:hypothetical protein